MYDGNIAGAGVSGKVDDVAEVVSAAGGAVDHFRRLWDGGYETLIPIVPPDAQLSPQSSLLRLADPTRPGSKPTDNRGKVPGERRDDGLWRGLVRWQIHETTEADLVRWQGWGAGVGIRTGLQADGSFLVLLDADVRVGEYAELIRDEIETRFGLLPCRIGQAPKAGYVLRLTEPLDGPKFSFGDPGESGRPPLFEVLTAGKQFVAHGIHPGTRRAYEWVRPLPPLAQVPTFAPADVVALVGTLQARLPKATTVRFDGAASTTLVSQESLRGDPDLVARAVALIPNGGDAYLDRDAYTAMGYAIKAALPDDEATALELFQGWCERWEEGDNDPDGVCDDWNRMKPPYRRGASWLYELAETAAPGQFSRGEQWFDGAAAAAASAPVPARERRKLRFLTIAEILDQPDPVFLIARHIPEGGCGFLYGDPGTGKSFVALDWAMHLAFGCTDWHGDAIRADPEACVVYLAGEGVSGYKARMRAWAARHGVPPEALRDGRRFRMLPHAVNMMDAEQVADLVGALKTDIGRVLLIVVDTVSRAIPGAEENLQKDMSLFVQRCDVLRDAFRCVVLGVHHANRKGAMRGSGVLKAAGDFVFRLERAEGAEVRTLACEKMKDAPDGWSDDYRFEVVPVEGGSSLVPTRNVKHFEPAAPTDIRGQMLEAMREAWDAGSPWGSQHQSGERYAPRRAANLFGLNVEEAGLLIRDFVTAGDIRDEVRSSKTKVKGYRVLSRRSVSSVFE